MERRLFFGIACMLLVCDQASAQVPLPYAPYGPYHNYGGGVNYGSPVVSGDSGVQVYPYDQQDPWLHGYFQRYPSYHGYTSYRPFNYRQVYSQAQLSAQWGAPWECHIPLSSGIDTAVAIWKACCTTAHPANTDPFVNTPANPRPGDVNPIGYRQERRTGSSSQPGFRR